MNHAERAAVDILRYSLRRDFTAHLTGLHGPALAAVLSREPREPLPVCRHDACGLCARFTAAEAALERVEAVLS